MCSFHIIIVEHVCYLGIIGTSQFLFIELLCKNGICIYPHLLIYQCLLIYICILLSLLIPFYSSFLLLSYINFDHLLTIPHHHLSLFPLPFPSLFYLYFNLYVLFVLYSLFLRCSLSPSLFPQSLTHVTMRINFPSFSLSNYLHILALLVVAALGTQEKQYPQNLSFLTQ